MQRFQRLHPCLRVLALLFQPHQRRFRPVQLAQPRFRVGLRLRERLPLCLQRVQRRFGSLPLFVCARAVRLLLRQRSITRQQLRQSGALRLPGCNGRQRFFRSHPRLLRLLQRGSLLFQCGGEPALFLPVSGTLRRPFQRRGVGGQPVIQRSECCRLCFQPCRVLPVLIVQLKAHLLRREHGGERLIAQPCGRLCQRRIRRR